jgi:hypothetical protein
LLAENYSFLVDNYLAANYSREVKRGIMGSFQQLLSSEFMPHGFCSMWEPRVVWLRVIADGVIALSYYCMLLIFIYFIRKNRDSLFNRVFWMEGCQHSAGPAHD